MNQPEPKISQTHEAERPSSQSSSVCLQAIATALPGSGPSLCMMVNHRSVNVNADMDPGAVVELNGWLKDTVTRWDEAVWVGAV